MLYEESRSFISRHWWIGSIPAGADGVSGRQAQNAKGSFGGSHRCLNTAAGWMCCGDL